MINELLDNIFGQINRGELGRALSATENLLYTYPHLYSTEPLLKLRDEYQLVVDYWQRGYDDPQRQQVCQHLLRRLSSLLTDVAAHSRMQQSAFLNSAYHRIRKSGRNWSVTAIRTELEDFVANTAIQTELGDFVANTAIQTELGDFVATVPEGSPEGQKAHQQGRQLYHQHQLFTDQLFDYVWTTASWDESFAQAMTDIILSPTVDVLDQQLLVSAVTLSAINAFDPSKLRLLFTVYNNALSEDVRQRALVGWVFALSVSNTHTDLSYLLDDQHCRKELAELQLQLYYCINADDDNRKIQQEIMPDLLKNNAYRVTRNGIEEVEEDPLQDILHPEASEQNIERMEQSVHKMLDMQRAGSDVYFGGFSQMKRYPFFQSISNWFVPFYPNHPAITTLMQARRGQKFLRAIVDNGPFCDSDKYSFVFAYEQVAARMPDKLIEMLESGEAQLAGTQLQPADTKTPTYIRRMYLQNLYRFFRLFPHRSEFRNPFLSADQYLFLANPLFATEQLADQHLEVAAFLYKRKRYEESARVMDAYRGKPTLRSLLLQGSLALTLHPGSGSQAANCFEQALQLSPDDEQALSGLARSRFREGDYQETLSCYEQLLRLKPHKKSYQLNHALCQTKLGRYEDALKTLYYLNYEHPDDHNVSRVLAWTLVACGKYEQAAKIYTRLLEVEQPAADDRLNYGYCLWLSRNIAAAIITFRQYVQQLHDSDAISREFFGDGYTLLQRAAITDTEIHLMLDQISSELSI